MAENPPEAATPADDSTPYRASKDSEPESFGIKKIDKKHFQRTDDRYKK